MNENDDFKKSDYKLYSNAKLLDLYVEKYIISDIPKVHAHARKELQDELYSLVREIYLAYYTEWSVRKKYVIEICASCSIIDHIIDKLRYVDVINIKKVERMACYLNNVNKIAFAWRNKLVG